MVDALDLFGGAGLGCAGAKGHDAFLDFPEFTRYQMASKCLVNSGKFTQHDLVASQATARNL